MAWFISKLTESYTATTSFDISYAGIPDSLLLANASKEDIDVRLRANGFQLLRFNFGKKKVVIDLSDINTSSDSYYVSQDIYRGQIERQLSDNIDLLETDRDTLFFDFYKVESKEVPVISQLNVSLAQNYLLDGAIQLVPEKVTIKGPKNEIDTINSVKTRNKTITDLNEDFSISIPLDISSVMENSSFSAYEVKAIGKVFRFSEKILEVPVEVINIPKGTEIKTFPNKVSVLCKAKIAMLKNVEADQFKVIADYAQISLNEASLEVHLIDIPDHVHSAQLQENRVDFILKRQ